MTLVLSTGMRAIQAFDDYVHKELDTRRVHDIQRANTFMVFVQSLEPTELCRTTTFNPEIHRFLS